MLSHISLIPGRVPAIYRLRMDKSSKLYKTIQYSLNQETFLRCLHIFSTIFLNFEARKSVRYISAIEATILIIIMILNSFIEIE